MSLFRTLGKCLMSTFLLSYFPHFYYPTNLRSVNLGLSTQGGKTSRNLTIDEP